MSNYNSLKATINANVRQNGNQEITGNILNYVLNAMVDTLGAGYQYIGVATPSSPGSDQTPDYNCFYLAATPGTYQHLGGIVVNEGELCALVYNGTWTKQMTGGASAEFVRKFYGEVFSVISLNRFDRDDLTIGYVVYSSGVISPNQNYRTSNYIKVTPGIKYRLNNNGNQQLAIYDENYEYVSGYSTSNGFNNAPTETQIPENGAYLRFCMPVSAVSTAVFYNSQEYAARNAWEDRTSYETGIVASQLKGQVIERTTTVGSMQGLLQVLATIIDTENYHYTIYLNEGNYTLTPAQIDSLQTTEYGRIGILLPNNVDLVGKGKGATIICDLTGQESGYQQYISPINMKWNNRLENLNIVVNNCRYAVHCDNSNTVSDIKWEIINCSFTHYGNSDGQWAYPHAWGEGGCSGHKAYFRNCTFRSPLGAFYVHNYNGNGNAGNRPMYHEFDNCRFIASERGTAFVAESLGSGCRDVLNFKGCTFYGLFDSRVGSGAASGTTSCDWEVIGEGNSPVCENWYYTDGINYHSNFGDEVIKFRNNSGQDLTSGMFMKYDTQGNLVPMEDGDDGRVFVGFLLDNVAVGAEGHIKVKGAYRVTSPAGVVWATLGTKVKVANYNTLGVADDIYNIGKMYYRNTVFSRYYILID